MKKKEISVQESSIKNLLISRSLRLGNRIMSYLNANETMDSAKPVQSQARTAEVLRKKLDELNAKKEKINSCAENETSEINNYWNLVREKAQLKINDLKRKMKDLNDAFIEKTKSLENKWLESPQNEYFVSEDTTKFLAEISKFRSDSLEYLSQLKIDDQVLKELIEKADSYLNQLDSQSCVLDVSNIDQAQTEIKSDISALWKMICSKFNA
jgi:hypothetical protein